MEASGEDLLLVDAETTFEVRLYIYDLSRELSKSFKKILKGKPLPDIWHTGLVAYGREYYFGSSGVESCRPGETILGEPDQILTLGKTELPYSVFLEYIFALGESTYKPGTYHLLEHNCNSFSQEVSNFLTGGPIPKELRDVSEEILSNKSLSNTLKEYFDKLCLKAEGSKGISFAGGSNSTPKGSGKRRSSAATATETDTPKTNGEVLVNGQHSNNNNNNDHQQPSTSKNHKKKENQQNSEETTKKASPKMPTVNGETTSDKENAPSTASQGTSSKSSGDEQAVSKNPTETQASATATSDGDGQSNSEGRRGSRSDDEPLPTFTSRRSRKYPEPALLYPEVDGITSYHRIMETIGGSLNKEESHSLNEILEYLTSPDVGAWALGTPHLDAFGRLLNDRNLKDETPVLALKVMSAAALKEDVILLLHQDREHHHVMSYLNRIENLPECEQEHIAMFMCNLCANTSSFDWLMYISEWQEEDGRSCNNSKVSVRVAVHSLLAPNPSIHDKGTALIFNLALKELFDDVATELAMAVMQFLQAELSEEHAYRMLTALVRFMCISYNEAPALLKMLGPDVRKFKGLSERVDLLVEEIHAKVSVVM